MCFSLLHMTVTWMSLGFWDVRSAVCRLNGESMMKIMVSCCLQTHDRKKVFACMFSTQRESEYMNDSVIIWTGLVSPVVVCLVTTVPIILWVAVSYFLFRQRHWGKRAVIMELWYLPADSVSLNLSRWNCDYWCRKVRFDLSIKQWSINETYFRVTESWIVKLLLSCCQEPFPQKQS